jgi:hypothetical protein
MARQPSQADLLAQKEAKQKKLLLLLLPVFLALLVWQGPKTYKAFTGGSAAPAPPPPAATTTTTPSPAPGTPAPPAGESLSLPDTDVRPDPLEGQLVSFSRFPGRDPFAVIRGPSSSGDDTDPTPNSGATIEVNGASESVAIGDPFPAGEPTFRLVSVEGQVANIGLVSGTFSSGAETIAIGVGETLVLVADNGERYAIKLVSLGSG